MANKTDKISTPADQILNEHYLLKTVVYAVSICHKISHQDCHDLSSKIA